MHGWVFLSGMMGSGKSTVAKALARSTDVPCIDLDARIERAAGKPVSAVFESDGEAAFRRLEARQLAAVLREGSPGVIALGGGAVTQPALRRQLLEVGTLVTLDASLDTLLSRVAGSDRPLLQRDPRAALERLSSQRAAAYAECHARIATDTLSPEQVATQVLACVRRAPVPVALGERTYRVDVRAGARTDLTSRMGTLAPTGPIVLVTDRNVVRWATPLAEALRAAGHRVVEVVLEPGEEHKNVDAVAQIWDAALSGGIDRRSVVVAVGGGVVGDLAGFAAATLMRGVRFVSVPTSLLAMVDASVGGKTGFDRPQGKNLVGAFHQPEMVLVDPETLETLPDAELRAGLAEVVKSAWLDSEGAVAALEADAAALVSRDRSALTRAVRMSVRLKARVVSDDEREGGVRRTLNLGHTVGHAIEASKGFSMRHGDAVALGLIAAFRLAASFGAPVEHGERMHRLLDALGLPTDLDAHVDRSTAAFLTSDKKRVGAGVAFIVPGAPGEVAVRRLPFEEVARRTGLVVDASA